MSDSKSSEGQVKKLCPFMTNKNITYSQRAHETIPVAEAVRFGFCVKECMAYNEETKSCRRL